MADSVELSTLYDDTRAFLTELAAENDRAWFAQNKARYDSRLKRPAERLLSEIAPTVEAIAGAPVRRKLFRPHRDVRFSDDKRPYHTHLHLLWSAEDGRGWFFGLSPEYASAGTGVMGFTPVQTDHWRAALDTGAGAALQDMLEQSGWRLNAPDLKRVPAPYPEDHPRAALMRHKGLVGWIDGLDAGLRADPRAALEDAFARLAPLSDWLGRHVTG